MPAVAESYSGPSGAVIAGGRFRMPNWRRSATPWQWVEVPSTLLSSIDPSQSPAMNPNYPSLAPWCRLVGGGANYHTNGGVIIPWCGACEHDGVVWLPLGGGHSDYGGNEAYRLDLKQDSPAWVMPRPPSGALPLIASGIPVGATVQGNSYLLDDGLDTTGFYADGRIRATHSYRKHTFVPGVGPVMAILGGCFSSANRSDLCGLSLNEATGEWTHHATATLTADEIGTAGAASCYDSTRGVVLHLPPGSGRIKRLDIATWMFSDHSVNTVSSSGNENLIFVAEYDVLLQINQVALLAVRDAATGAKTQPSLLGSGPTLTGHLGVDWLPGVGLVVHDGYGANNAAVWVLSPTGNIKTDPWQWATMSVTGSPPVATASAGFFSRFGYSKRMKGFFRVDSSTAKPWFLATE